jgi:uncharacterized protein YecT (DUF1311 family)
VFSQVHAKCIEKADFRDSLILDCLYEELDRQDEQLNKTYKQLLTQLPGERKESLKKIQRKWIEYRNLTCDYLASAAGSEGWVVKLEYAECLARITAGRVVELNYLTKYPN